MSRLLCGRRRTVVRTPPTNNSFFWPGCRSLAGSGAARRTPAFSPDQARQLHPASAQHSQSTLTDPPPVWFALQELHQLRAQAAADAEAWAEERAALRARVEAAESALSDAQMRIMEFELGVQQPESAQSAPQAAWEHGAAEEHRERYRELEDDLAAAEGKVQARGGGSAAAPPLLRAHTRACAAHQRPLTPPLAHTSLPFPFLTHNEQRRTS